MTKVIFDGAGGDRNEVEAPTPSSRTLPYPNLIAIESWLFFEEDSFTMPTSMAQEDSILFSVKDIMTTFNISRRTVYLWIEKGVLLPIKIEGILRFHPEDVQALIAQNRTESGALSSRKKILAIDDDILVRESLKSLLRKQGFEVTVLQNAEEAIAHLTKSNILYDLVIADVRMPGMNGIEMLQELRRIRIQKRQEPFGEIVITGYSDPAAKKQAKTIGIRHFLMKPFDINDFYQEIHKALDLGGAGKN